MVLFRSPNNRLLRSRVAGATNLLRNRMGQAGRFIMHRRFQIVTHRQPQHRLLLAQRGFRLKVRGWFLLEESQPQP